jgi:hypothetical protein
LLDTDSPVILNARRGSRKKSADAGLMKRSVKRDVPVVNGNYLG